MQDQLPRLFGSHGNLQMPIDHEFGGQHTDLKLSIVESYLNGNPQGAAADGARCPIS
jgi:hypothetical protein